MEKLTIEEALNNIAIAIDKYVGTKREHIILEESFNLIKDKIEIKTDVLKESK